MSRAPRRQAAGPLPTSQVHGAGRGDLPPPTCTRGETRGVPPWSRAAPTEARVGFEYRLAAIVRSPGTARRQARTAQGDGAADGLIGLAAASPIL